MEIHQERRPPGALVHNQTLPSITSLTGDLHNHANVNGQTQQQDVRDSGNWSISQSKREYNLSPPSCNTIAQSKAFVE